MSDVVQWNPKSANLSSVHAEVLHTLANELDSENFSLTKQQREILGPVVCIQHNSWSDFAKNRSTDLLVGWIKVLVLCAEQYPDLESGAKSPVIPLVRILRQRGHYPTTLTTWIKSHSTNKFLPYGSLDDRLRRN
ncbi:MAG: hypothetical protein F4039_02455 [Gammaproteobacteria bacterium]|nr:hypothetical protein [Gammaproteobacteria bacterium]MXX95871.1 hypothetical protein [Gammaproteobacteria bacterium]MYF53132.1 hypothetical protein [Gammaproteobacteria bacterium]MYK42936.1 hypothetical protein [Gammaproteobacteria bacterium]